MHFPDVARKIPVRQENFPVPSLREFEKVTAQYQLFIGAPRVRFRPFS
jgi:hypothetical protein